MDLENEVRSLGSVMEDEDEEEEEEEEAVERGEDEDAGLLEPLLAFLWRRGVVVNLRK